MNLTVQNTNRDLPILRTEPIPPRFPVTLLSTSESVFNCLQIEKPKISTEWSTKLSEKVTALNRASDWIKNYRVRICLISVMKILFFAAIVIGSYYGIRHAVQRHAHFGACILGLLPLGAYIVIGADSCNFLRNAKRSMQSQDRLEDTSWLKFCLLGPLADIIVFRTLHQSAESAYSKLSIDIDNLAKESACYAEWLEKNYEDLKKNCVAKIHELMQGKPLQTKQKIEQFLSEDYFKLNGFSVTPAYYSTRTIQYSTQRQIALKCRANERKYIDNCLGMVIDLNKERGGVAPGVVTLTSAYIYLTHDYYYFQRIQQA